MGSRDQMPTVRICIVCHGNYVTSREDSTGTYHYSTCKWCSEGIMTDTQYKERLEYEKIKGIDTKKFDVNRE